mmetsp:Transcript_53014/g.96826  ORF Transcript_53014/g.96826 Transcript_53014/m.96826 type:complete len:122 (+) Transcript_53014:870-1235(+)
MVNSTSWFSPLPEGAMPERSPSAGEALIRLAQRLSKFIPDDWVESALSMAVGISRCPSSAMIPRHPVNRRTSEALDVNPVPLEGTSRSTRPISLALGDDADEDDGETAAAAEAFISHRFRT